MDAAGPTISPNRYAYDPPWRLCIYCSAIGFAALVFFVVFSSAASWSTRHLWRGFKDGMVPAAPFFLLSLVVPFRRLAFPRFLEVGKAALLPPEGFLRARMISVPYGDNLFTWEIKGAIVGDSFSMACGSGRFTVRADFLPDQEAYADIRDYIAGARGGY